MSDYAAASLIGITKQAISAARLKKPGFGEKSALKIAELLDTSPHEVIANLMAEKCAKEQVQTVCLEISKRFAACAALLFCAAIVAPADAIAATRQPSIDTMYFYDVESLCYLFARIQRLHILLSMGIFPHGAHNNEQHPHAHGHPRPVWRRCS